MTDWARSRVAPDGTHHVQDGRPLYEQRFDEVLSFHHPGLAAVRSGIEAWHITTDGEPAYAQRFQRSFGFYEDRAAVVDGNRWHHVLPDGCPAYPARHAWCGNYQEGRCPVRLVDGHYRHIDLDGRPAYDELWRYAGDYRHGAAVVQAEDGQHTHVDLDGRLVHGRWFLDLDVFHKGLARARDADGWLHVDRHGQPAYERRFAMVEPFYNGQARVQLSDGSLEVIDESGVSTVQLRGAIESPLQRLSNKMVGFWRTQAIRAAVELGVFEAFPGSTEHVANETTLGPQSSARLLRALWEIGLVAREGSRWLPTDTGSLLRRDSGSGMADAALLWGTEHYEAWSRLGDALISGEAPFDELFGAPFFDWLRARPDELRRYQRAIRGYAEHDYAALAGVLALDDVEHVVDAGGGSGVLLTLLLERHPSLQGTLLDLPEVADGVVIPAAVRSRLSVVGADLFSTWPCSGELVVLGRVLHDWNDERARQVLMRAQEALTVGGRIAVIDLVLSDQQPNGGLLDLNMLVVCGSLERTRAGWESLAQSAGMRVASIAPLPTYGSLLTLEVASEVAR